ncbi:hypothetical protein LTR10_019792 [Elasticomyces elasticus]|uniref:Uncharacterized protein n=1 Tax=Exophiala sideris TaxID=1016849 RepID=A0ABR0JCN0_9EURO|nr:hypothetical protein LTR10_019792 [Elasticomyces elasticus]KAK5032079.1 hypothetical protein LTS07_004701 [Exophiala sideris]KAK5041007.1 hypothetical protein LTR13_003309 [Exophiala sideris]KAK5061659.1 hypothetical protein LTR69_004841 [Exophiala sideris]KAK5184359.1 hypothetical protein LTR44_003032 [Eurotiomycetes sp. CCFEE 6388]
MSEQLRRTTRHQDHNASQRTRGDLFSDPAEGLPVRVWRLSTVKINQDASAETEPNRNTETRDTAGLWGEAPLPSFFSQLPEHNQQMIRKARMVNTNPRDLLFDDKLEMWVDAKDVGSGRVKPKNVPSNNAESPESNEEADNDDNEDDDLIDADGLPQKRRKTNAGLQERVFEIKKWTQVPISVAEKMPEPKYLADRRPGMPSLYGGAYKATNGFGALGPNPGMGAGAVGFDLGDGSGLGNATGVMGGAQGEATPVRKNMPPRRKKKKLGGPGRRKANPVPTEDATAATTPADAVVNETQTPAADNEQDNDQSEGEGSEEGEIDEGGKDEAEDGPKEEAQEIVKEITVEEAKEIAEDGAKMDIEEPAKMDITEPVKMDTQEGAERTTENVAKDQQPGLGGKEETVETTQEAKDVDMAPPVPEEPVVSVDTEPAEAEVVEVPAIVEIPAIEVPAVETPAVDTPVLEVPAIETTVIEVPPVEEASTSAPNVGGDLAGKEEAVVEEMDLLGGLEAAVEKEQHAGEEV